MPPKEGLGPHEKHAPALFGKDPACRSEQCSVPPAVDRALDLPTQDLQLVAEDQDLNFCGIVGAMLRRDKGEEPAKHYIEERGEHGRDSVTPDVSHPSPTQV